MSEEKLEFARYTGKDPQAYTSPEAFTLYAQRHLGVEIPVGKDRYTWYTLLKDEMRSHGWDWDDLAKAVRYLKAHKKVVVRPFGVLYFVDEARKWVEHLDDYELHAKVADALASETDDGWRRKLSLAQGRALEAVYKQWEQAREVRG